MWRKSSTEAAEIRACGRAGCSLINGGEVDDDDDVGDKWTEELFSDDADSLYLCGKQSVEDNAYFCC